MLWFRAVCALTFLLLLLAGCNQPASSAGGKAPAGTNAAAPVEPAGRPQPKLPTLKLWLGTNELTAEIAATRQQVQMGMMWRTNMAEMAGMLFVFPEPHRAAFWMKNTLIPLSCAYIDSTGTILEIRDMKPRDETSLEAETDQVQYVLEVNQGWFQRHGVGRGAVVRTERGSLAETFFGKKQGTQ